MLDKYIKAKYKEDRNPKINSNSKYYKPLLAIMKPKHRQSIKLYPDREVLADYMARPELTEIISLMMNVYIQIDGEKPNKGKK